MTLWLTDLALSIGFVFAITFILGWYLNTRADRQHPRISYTWMVIVAAIGALLMLLFPAVFLIIDRWL